MRGNWTEGGGSGGIGLREVDQGKWTEGGGSGEIGLREVDQGELD